MITYEPLRKMMKDMGITWYALGAKYGIGGGTLNKLRDDENVTVNTLDILCEIFECDLCNLVKYTPNKEPRQFPKDRKKYEG